jgi:serine/threonine protein kinase
MESSVFVQPPDVYEGTTDSQSPPSWDGTRSSVPNVVSFDTRRPLSSFCSLLKFLTTSSIRILDPDDIENDESETGKRGNSMEVFQGRFNGTPVALKRFRWPQLDSHHPTKMKEVIDKYQQYIYDLLFELKIMSHEPLCHHRNIARAFGVTFDKKTGDLSDPSLTDLINPIVVVELAHPEFPDLSDLFAVKPQSFFTFNILANLVSDIADGIAILHEYGLVHSDIKPENILVFYDGDKLTAKIGDFGAAGLEATNDKPRAFTRYWAAPESLEECPLPGVRCLEFRKAHDVYSFGLVLGFIMLLGKHPFIDVESQDNTASSIKFDDIADDMIYKSIQKFWQGSESPPDAAKVLDKLQSVQDVLERTLRLFPNARLKDLNCIRQKITDS